MPKELILTAPRQLQLAEFEQHPLEADEVRAEAIISGISHGTELNLYSGSSPFKDQFFDPDLRLFLPKTDDLPEEVSRIGYEWVGRVNEVGAAVKNFKVGDLVHLPFHHSQTHTFKADHQTMIGGLTPLRPGLEPEAAIFLALAGVALQAIHDAHIKVGDRVTIFGLGAIGLLAVQLAKLNGASWVDAVDPLPNRREWAARLGADQTYDPTAGDVAYAIKSASPECGADVALEVSGNYAALNEAIRTVRKAGTVVAAGFYRGGGTPLHFGAEWHHNRITMVSSMGVWECPHRDHPLWNRGRVHEMAAQLLESGKLNTEELISHRIPFTQASEAYTLIEQHPEQVTKVVLTY
jgi:2-desacetyl-2-hydroxyethyl bacteriochlorophyllide A dehydrogenase